MDQSHIGYTTWADPPQNSLGAITLVEPAVPRAAGLGVAVDGSTAAWPGATIEASLPVVDALNQQRHWIEVFDRGQAPFDYAARASAPWILVSAPAGHVTADTRLWVTVDWAKAPAGSARGTVTISGAGSDITVGVRTLAPAGVTRASLTGFAEGGGYVSMEAEHYTRKIDAGAARWIRIEDYGRTLSGMRASAPVDTPSATPGPAAARLDYDMYVSTTGPATASLILSPTLNFVPGRGLRLAVAFDDATPQTIAIVPEGYSAQNGNADWERSVRDNARTVSATQAIASPGMHTLHVWMVDPAVVVQKIVVATGGATSGASYLGPPESYRH
jgi:hypothetical protein